MSDRNLVAEGKGIPIVAIGASAGGLEACRALLAGLPAETPAAFVLILHLDPSHDSMMVDLLARATGLTVVQAADGMALRSGHVHVIPPGAFLTVARNQLRLTVPEGGKGVRMPFDVLLRSLARDAGTRSACIVLSGTGTDGSLGLAAIHAAGGLVIAQDPHEAGYPGMPESAIASGLVHRILTTDKMPSALAEHWALEPDVHHSGAAISNGAEPHADRTTDNRDAPASDESRAGQDYGAIIDFVGRNVSRDLSLYKSGTLERRIARRMALVGVAPAEADRYLALLESDPAETAQLAADLLIHVTGFFRDPAVFAHLSEHAVPALLAELPDDRPLRVWVAGCSTGEEVYSLAMVCLEAIAAQGATRKLQILASDIDPDAVATAREGYYPSAIEAHVSPARLARFFVRESGGWRVRAALRDVIVFTVADLLSDPPFSRIDLLSCRNLLIYLGPEAQRRVIAVCCFALRPGGLLLLGAAETPGPPDGRFAVADKAARLWRRVGNCRPGDLHVSPTLRTHALAAASPPSVGGAALAELCRRAVLDSYAPAAVLMNRRLDCLYMLGPTERYLRVGQGYADPGILGMLPKAIRARVRDAASGCDLSTPLVTIPGGVMPGEGAFRIDLRAVPAGAEVLLLACFIPVPATEGRIAADTPADGPGEGDLEAELGRTRSELGTALRDLEREVEAHDADAAEALSVNEEFQSTNEELLASKEELQSLNEELTALNSQLQETLERHRTTANDLQNVLFSTDVATLFLDRDLNIRFFTPAARALLRVIPTDIGRPLADLAATAADDMLLADARAVLARSEQAEREIPGAQGLWYLRRIQPYRGEGGQVDGVVITFADITERKRTTAALREAMQAAESATRAKSRFLAAASHDLRQPLQALALLHGLMARSRGKTEADRLAALLDRTLRAMTEMLDSLLDLNRIEAGIVRPRLVPVALGPLIARVTEEFAPLCGQKGLKLRVVPCKAWVRTDPKLLEQMLRNLLSNAQKYTDRGGILVGCRRRGRQLSLQVCDTGIGIARSAQKAIFEAYHQLDTTGAQSGHGLGLSIVQRLSQLLDHPVTVRSTPGKGSAFMIALPMVVAEATALAVAPTVQRPDALATGTVLLVEDDDQLRDLLAEILEAAGFAVVSRRNARDALAWAAEGAARPDLLLADLDLSDGPDGLALARELPDALGFEVPTLILTGDISAATIKLIEATPYAHLVKPVLPEVLLARLSELLTAASGPAAKAGPGSSDPLRLTVHLVDDDPLLREAARRLFEVEGWNVVTYPSAETFLAAPRPRGAACLVVDAQLPGMDGISLLRVLREQPPMPPAVVLTGHGDAAMAVAAMKAGAADLIEKPVSATELLASVRTATTGSDSAGARDSARRAAEHRFARLTARERDVLARVLQGAPNKIVAAELGINQRTVENHRAAVMRKTGAVSLPALVRLALAAGFEAS